MEFKTALGALAPRVEIRGQYYSTTAATRDGVRPGQIWRFRAKALRLRTLRRAAPLFTAPAARILVTSLSILSVVTHEVFAPLVEKRVPMPNVCLEFEVEYFNTFEMLKNLNVKFILSTKTQRPN